MGDNLEKMGRRVVIPPVEFFAILGMKGGKVGTKWVSKLKNGSLSDTQAEL